MRKAKVLFKDMVAGYLTETDNGYQFAYTENYLDNPLCKPVSLTLPLTNRPYHSPTMFPFFDGLIPEGWMLDIASRNWKLSPNDRMGLLMTCCHDCIGAVSVIGLKEEEE